jgi:hypothetical protein
MKLTRERQPRPSATAGGSRALERARARIHRAVGEVVSGSIEALAEHVPGERLPWARAKPTAEAGLRLRTVLEIDRYMQAQEARLLRAAVPAPLVAPSAPARAAAAERETCDEPIRTRSMARLLAKQGHGQRALTIYDYLLAGNPSDGELRAEADAVRVSALG